MTDAVDDLRDARARQQRKLVVREGLARDGDERLGNAGRDLRDARPQTAGEEHALHV
jgi:hypothetical protein